MGVGWAWAELLQTYAPCGGRNAGWREAEGPGAGNTGDGRRRRRQPEAGRVRHRLRRPRGRPLPRGRSVRSVKDERDGGVRRGVVRGEFGELVRVELGVDHSFPEPRRGRRRGAGPVGFAGVGAGVAHVGFVGVGTGLVHEEPKPILNRGEVPGLRGTLRAEVHAVPTLRVSAFHFGIVDLGPQVGQGWAEAAMGLLAGALLLAFL